MNQLSDIASLRSFARGIQLGNMNMRCFPKHFCVASSRPQHCPLLSLPSPMEVHFWYVIPDQVKNLSLLNDYLELLPPCEKENVLSYGEDKLRKRALLSRVLVRTTIARYQINNVVGPKSLRFKKNIHGKPEVDWQHNNEWHPPELHFNLSHTSSVIACALSIGIDVEEKSRVMKNDVLSFAKRFFSQPEFSYLASIPDCKAQHEEFIKLWTLKEAYVKARGTGFSASPFNSFQITYKDFTESDSPENSASRVSDIAVEYVHGPKGLTNNWQFALLGLTGNHYAAICMEKCRSDVEGMKEGSRHMYLRGWRTIPLIEDECVSGTDSLAVIGGLIKQLPNKI